MNDRVQRTQLFKGFSSFENNKDIVYDLEIVKRDLFNHFHTRKGERVMFPQFGSIIWDSLFEPFTDQLRDIIVEDTINILNLDSRITVDEVIADTFEHGIVIQATVTYHPFDVVETFSLEFDRRTITEFGNTAEI